MRSGGVVADDVRGGKGGGVVGGGGPRGGGTCSSSHMGRWQTTHFLCSRPSLESGSGLMHVVRKKERRGVRKVRSLVVWACGPKGWRRIGGWVVMVVDMFGRHAVIGQASERLAAISVYERSGRQ